MKKRVVNATAQGGEASAKDKAASARSGASISTAADDISKQEMTLKEHEQPEPSLRKPDQVNPRSMTSTHSWSVFEMHLKHQERHRP